MVVGDYGGVVVVFGASFGLFLSDRRGVAMVPDTTGVGIAIM